MIMRGCLSERQQGAEMCWALKLSMAPLRHCFQSAACSSRDEREKSLQRQGNGSLSQWAMPSAHEGTGSSTGFQGQARQKFVFTPGILSGQDPMCELVISDCRCVSRYCSFKGGCSCW